MPEAKIPEGALPLLDHGYLRLIETWGSEERIIEAARMSTDGGFRGWGPVACINCNGRGTQSPVVECTHCEGRGYSLGTAERQGCACCDGAGHVVAAGEPHVRCTACKGTGQVKRDEKLLRYLYENRHSTPFEMAGLIIEVQAPILVFREWHRHRTQSYNELSARYTPLPAMDYIPTVERLMINAGKGNKQAGTVKGSEELTVEAAEEYRVSLKIVYENNEHLYQTALKHGVPKELARCHLPVGRYSRMRASANLRNWLAFLTLREDSKAMWEIRQYAHQVSALIKEHYPRTHALYVEGRGF